MKKKWNIGYNDAFEVRQERYSMGDGPAFCVLYLSDFHFTRYSQSLVLRLLQTIEAVNPDILLLGGDYADSSSGRKWLEYFLQTIRHRKNVFAIAGNHDYWRSIDTIQTIMRRNGVCWLEKEPAYVPLTARFTVRIDGGQAYGHAAPANFYILCLHKPVRPSVAIKHYHLVFGGHLHGTQFVLWQNDKGLYPGRWLYQQNFLKMIMGRCLYLVSKGLGDTLPVRFNCTKDIILVNVNSQP
ncbi:hypothetical protein SAMN05421788_102460 [Filimonas lacunae]|uniref:Calcineurin-like phosphoesterase domain-containing protein n=1 Tax=Filimonas lacunae TaxID=477680 RepID=A0A173MH33_9BACT|nr:metallophosphoesterase [Filimonas lacunae]BAV06905.1 Ser/Thr protein phosphatase family protein [Filimonas lacunae]SIS98029.1 hypothetical protein SAMN05421788_102460 [Filimonas lacunae]